MRTPERQIELPAWERKYRGRRALAAAPALLVAVWMLAGCGRVSAPASDNAADTSPPADTGTASAPGEPPASDADLVSAVNSAGQAKPISVKFRVEARPVVGMPVKVLLALMPAADGQIGHVHGSFTAGEGLMMQSPTSFDLTDLKPGTPQYREVTVVPQQTGVLDLDATLLLQTDQATETRTYSIPLIAADNSSP